MFFSYLLGAAVMFFELPTSEFLSKAFIGARAWNEKREVLAEMSGLDSPSVSAGGRNQPDKYFDGFTLYACATLDASSNQAFLIDMRGRGVHHWSINFSDIWPDPPHIKVKVDDRLVGFFGCHLYGNGDLLAVLHGYQRAAYGYGLVKLDRSSKVLWKYAANVHHDVDVGEDGTIYAIQHELVDSLPKGLEWLPTPCLVDSLVILSPEGKLRGRPIPILEALQNSPYAELLSSLKRPGRQEQNLGGMTGVQRYEEAVRRQDALHTNFAKVLSHKMAPKFPQFKAGQVLLSMRNLDTIAVLDVDTRKVVWAARGPWHAQHDPQFLDNGRILIFDNLGQPRRSRVLEYDPQSQALPWSYAGGNQPDFLTKERGMCQRLPNGNTLVVISEQGKLVEVTPAGEVVWTCITTDRTITSARRYSPQELPFLKKGQPPR
jgi:hypothetical protein